MRAAAARETTLDTTLLALADPVRRGAIDLMRKSPRKAGELAHSLGVARPAMSKHLKVLRDTGLIEHASGDDARERIYRLCPEPFAEVRAWIEDVERFWTLELAAFKAHVEKKKR